MSWQTVERGIRRWTDNKGRHTYFVHGCRNGERWQKKAGSNLDHARQLRSKLILEVAERAEFPERKKVERIRLDEFCERYLEDHLKTSAAKSWKKEESRIKAIKEILGNPYVDSITTRDIVGLLSELRRNKKKPATLNRVRARLSSMMNKAIAWGYRIDNPVSGVERLREETKGDRFLHRHEYEALLKVCDPELRALVEVATNTGARQNELMSLRWSDVDLELGFMTVRPENSKTSEGRRIPLNSDAQEALDTLGPNGEGRVFPWVTFPRKRWIKIVKAVGWDKTEVPRLTGWRFHDLRHTCASWLVQSGIPIVQIARILGHKTLATTLRYSHLCDSTLVDALDKISSNAVRNEYVMEEAPTR